MKILLAYTHSNHPCLEKASALNLMEVALVRLVGTQYCNAARVTMGMTCVRSCDVLAVGGSRITRARITRARVYLVNIYSYLIKYSNRR